MSMRDPVFAPVQGTTKTVTTVLATSVSANWTGDQYNTADSAVMEVFNTTASVVFVAWGLGAQTATANSYPVPGPGTRRFQCGPNVDTVAVLQPAGTVGAVYVTRGEGGVSP